MHDLIVEELADRDELWSFQVPMFDRLEPLSRLCLLADVGEALLTTTPLPSLTAINESAVGAMFNAVKQLVALETDEQKDEAGSYGQPFRYRTLLLTTTQSHAAADDATRMDTTSSEVLPLPDCVDTEEWEWLVEAGSDRILWDEDYLYGHQFLDAPPEAARLKRDRLGITSDYFAASAPDPKESALASIRARLNALERGKS